MADMKLKLKKQLMKRKVDGATLTGYIGKVVTNGRKDFDEIARAAVKNTTLHPKEASMAAELLLEGVADELRQGYIVDLGPLGVIYPAVNTPWKQDADDLKLSDMKPKVNYKACAGIAAAVRSASLAWATAKDVANGATVDDDDNDNDVTPADSTPSQQGGGSSSDSSEGGNDGNE